MVVVLHNVRSMHNVGSIFRTADAAGIERLYLCGITPGPIDRFGRPNAQLLKVSLGAERTVTWEHVSSAARLIMRLKREGFRILALEQDPASIPYTRASLSVSQWQTTALILGEEVKGLPLALLKKTDKILEIPMHGEKESLNVSVAFGIVIFHLLAGRG